MPVTYHYHYDSQHDIQELLSLAQQRRELQQLRIGSRSTAIPNTDSVHSLDQINLPPLPNHSQITPTHSALSLSHPPPPPTTTLDHLVTSQPPQFVIGSHHHHSTLHPYTSVPPTAGAALTNSLGGMYSPRASPVHTYNYDFPVMPLQRPSVKSKLEAIEQSRSLRNLELDARKVQVCSD